MDKKPICIENTQVNRLIPISAKATSVHQARKTKQTSKCSQFFCFVYWTVEVRNICFCNKYNTRQYRWDIKPIGSFASNIVSYFLSFLFGAAWILIIIAIIPYYWLYTYIFTGLLLLFGAPSRVYVDIRRSIVWCVFVFLLIFRQFDSTFQSDISVLIYPHRV